MLAYSGRYRTKSASKMATNSPRSRDRIRPHIVKLGNWVLRSAWYRRRQDRHQGGHFLGRILERLGANPAIPPSRRCRQAEQWLGSGVALPPVAVNVSALQFKASRDLENEIEAVLAETRLSPRSLEIELTETALMGSSSGHDNVVERLRARGLRIAIDDFGTGYSSLLYLRRFPVDRIKVAQEFVKDIGIEPNDTAIVKAAIGLARELGIGVVAEGVESADQVQLLHEWGCRQAQGFYFAAPMPAEDVLPLLRAGSVMRWRAAAPNAPGWPRRLAVVKSPRS